MKTLFTKAASFLLFVVLLLAGSAAHAQSGNGAYVQKFDRDAYIGGSLLGAPGSLLGSSGMTMTQTKYMLTPSGKGMAVWVGNTTPPAAKSVYKTVWDVIETTGISYHYTSSCTVFNDGSVTLVLNGDEL